MVSFSKKGSMVLKGAKKRGRPSKKVTTATQTQTEIDRLKYGVQQLRQRVYGNTNTVFMWSLRAENQAISQPYAYWNLLPLNAFSPCFGDDATDLNDSNKLILKKMKLDLQFNASIEKDLVDVTLFVVSFKDDAANGIRFDPGTGTINLVSGVDYTINGGQARLNPRVFNIYYVKRFNLGNGGIAWSSTGIGDKKMYMKRIAKSFKLDYSIIAPGGNWRLIPCPTDPDKTRFLLAFNNDFTADGESVRADVMVNVTAVNPR